MFKIGDMVFDTVLEEAGVITDIRELTMHYTVRYFDNKHCGSSSRHPSWLRKLTVPELAKLKCEGLL